MNNKLLRAELILKGKKPCEVASLLGISKSSFYRKLKGSSLFTQSEIANMRDILEITNEKIIAIFFGEKVS